MDDLQIITDMISAAKSHGLETEVILEAIKIAKQNPEQSLESICMNALDEWDI